MKRLLTFFILVVNFKTIFSQPTINGDMSSGYGAALASSNGNDCYGNGNNVGSLYTYKTATHLYVGVTCDLADNNKVVIFFDFDDYGGRASGTNLNAISSNLDGAKLGGEVDFAMEVNEGNSTTNLHIDLHRLGTSGGLSNAYLGSITQDGTSSTLGTNSGWGGSGDITIAYNNAGMSSNRGLEFSVPFSAFPGVTGSSTNVKLFVLITNNSGHASNESIPGMNSAGCPGNDADMSTFTSFTSNAPLAVDLLSFSAVKEKNQINLLWSTANEHNNSHFDIERSLNGKTFYKIGQVKGTGNSVETQKYSFLDINPSSGINYYRIKSVDVNGKLDYSFIVTVEGNNKISDKKAFVFPNPANNDIVIKFESSDDSGTNIQIFDLAGKQLLNQTFETYKGDNQLSISVDNLPKGAYFIKLNNEVLKFFKM